MQDAANTECSLDYAFDIETYVPITFEGETEFEFDVCDSTYEFELDTNSIIGGNPIIDDNDNAIYNLRWTYTPLDPNEPGSSFRGRTSFDAGRGTYELVISDGVCESEVIEFVFSGDVDVLSIDGLLANNEISQGVSCELGAKMEEFRLISLVDQNLMIYHGKFLIQIIQYQHLQILQVLQILLGFH